MQKAIKGQVVSRAKRRSMKKEELTKEALTSLLKEAEKAHAEYEYALGHRDDDWATWYAGFIIDRLQEDNGTTNPDEEK
jgi:hypothetical protein